MKNQKKLSYLHKDTGTEERIISGYYSYLEENRLSIPGRDMLYVVGIGIVDNSCCGIGGCLFIEVLGYVVSWKSDVDREGGSVSLVDPINTDEEKEKIRKALLVLYPQAQVNFDC